MLRRSRAQTITKAARMIFLGGGGGDAQIAGKGGIGSGRNNRGNSDMGFDLFATVILKR